MKKREFSDMVLSFRFARRSALFLCIVFLIPMQVFATSEAGDPIPPSPGLDIDPAVTAGDVQTKSNTIRFPEVKARSVREPAVTSVNRQSGVLSGRIVFLSAGHGAQWSSTLGRWATDRGVWNNMVEDFGSHDQVNYLAAYLFNAGATIVPLRPIGNQTNEVVLDNNDVGVTFSGAWSNSTGGQFYGTVGDPVSYRFTVGSSGGSETALATYRPNIGQPGYYPIYTWVLNSANRAPDQLYRIHTSGGVSEVRVNHIRVGRGWVYLGSYYLEAGTGAYVEISNQSSGAGNVIADAIRFGNGMGNVVDNTVSGLPREDESSQYWYKSMMGVGGTSSIYDAGSVGGRPQVAAYMNNSADGKITDRVYLSVHSNADSGVGTARGATALINNGNCSGGTCWNPTPNQAVLAAAIGNELKTDMPQFNSQLPANWADRSATASGVFGELRTDLINSEMDSTIAEVAFHTNASDSLIMRTPLGRQLIARSLMHGLIKYFNQIPNSGGALSFPPNTPVNVKVVGNGNSGAVVSWAAPPADPAGAGTPSSYVVYRSTNGYAFGNPVTATGTSTNITGLTAGQVVYFRVASRNSAGESFPTETVAVRVPATGTNPVLIVNGFDRADASCNIVETRTNMGLASFQRIKPWRTNNYDYVVRHAQALAAAGYYFDSSSNEALTGPLVNGYQVVDWCAGEDSTVDEALSNAEQTLLQNFLNLGNKGLFISGSEIGWDLEASTGGVGFYNNFMLTKYESDDAGTYSVNVRSGIFSSVPAFSFGGLAAVPNTTYPPPSNGLYDADYPDVISELNGSSIVLKYSTGGGAAVAGAIGSTGSKVISFGFPFELITSAAARNAIMQYGMEYLMPASAVSDWNLY